MIRLLRYIIFSLFLIACSARFHVSEVKPTHYDTKSAKNDSISLLNTLPYKTELDKDMSQVVAYSDSALTRDGFESSLGNFVLEAIENFTDSNRKDIGMNPVIILNRGGLRNNLPKGEITKGNIFEVMPFDNEIVFLKISGQKLMDCITALLNEKKIISWNLSLTLEKNEPKNIFLYNGPFNINETYYVVTSDYLAQGGDNCSFFGKPVSYETTGIKIRDAILRYCESLTKKKQSIKPKKLGKIKISK